jgi:uncharacterized protein
LIETASLDIHICQTFMTRLSGALLQKRLDKRTAFWLCPCQSVHTFGMREPITLFFVDRALTILEVVPALWPYSVRAHARAHSVIEMGLKQADEIEQIVWEIEGLHARICLLEYADIGRIKARV